MDGIVLYTDGSFRQNKAGWGIHGYTYNDVAMKSKAATKQQPTARGYEDVEAKDTVTVIEYIDGYGKIEGKATNNTAELGAAIGAFEYALTTPAKSMVMRMDSEYVRKGISSWIPGWQRNNWVKPDGLPVANKDYWLRLIDLKASWLEPKRKLELQWIKGHSNDTGNDKADANALLGANHETKYVVKPAGEAADPVVAGSMTNPVLVEVEAAVINKPKKQPVNPLVLESRLLFGFNTGEKPDGFYYMFNLGRSSNYGAKPKDSAKDKLAKADLLIGRPISDATFGVYKALEPDEFIESLIDMHAKEMPSVNPELGVINLANVYSAQIRSRLDNSGSTLLTKHTDILTLATGDHKLISRTLNPPRRANEAVAKFQILQRQLEDYLSGRKSMGVDVIDVTDLFFEQVTSGKKEIRQLKKTITQNTQAVEATVKFRERDVKIKLVLNIDIPSRNQLNRIGAGYSKVALLITAVGPMAYSYATAFVTDDGSAIYQSPYTQFILPK
jgi:ribonuclease HI